MLIKHDNYFIGRKDGELLVCQETFVDWYKYTNDIIGSMITNDKRIGDLVVFRKSDIIFQSSDKQKIKERFFIEIL